MSGVQQGCVLPPFLFLLIIDFVMKKTVTSPVFGNKWKHDQLTDLDFADGIALLSGACSSFQDMTTKLHKQTTKLGLCISCEKAKMMSVATEQLSPLAIGQQTIEYVDNFPCLGSYISWIGDAEVNT